MRKRILGIVPDMLCDFRPCGGLHHSSRKDIPANRNFFWSKTRKNEIAAETRQTTLPSPRNLRVKSQQPQQQQHRQASGNEIAASGRNRSDTLPTQLTTHDNQQTDWMADTAAGAVSLFRFDLANFSPNENKRTGEALHGTRRSTNDTVRGQLFGYPSESTVRLRSRSI